MFLLLKTKNSNKIAIVLPHLSILFFIVFIFIPRDPPSSSKEKKICVIPEGKKGSGLYKLVKKHLSAVQKCAIDSVNEAVKSGFVF